MVGVEKEEEEEKEEEKEEKGGRGGNCGHNWNGAMRYAQTSNGG
jgi:hypothetical protein